MNDGFKGKFKKLKAEKEIIKKGILKFLSMLARGRDLEGKLM